LLGSSGRVDGGGEPVRIGIVGSRGFPYVYSGYETFVAHLARGLVQRGHEVVVYCHRELFEDRPAEVDGVSLVYAPGIRSKTLSQLTHSLTSTLHVITRGLDLVLYVNSSNGPFGPLLRILRIPSAINVDGLEWLRPKWAGMGARYFRWASRMAARSFDEVVTDAEAMAQIYEQEFGRSSTTIAYGATPRFAEHPELLDRFGLTPDEYFLVVGRLIPDNNADLIVEAFAQTSTRRKLVVVGDVPYADEFSRRVKSVSDERVVFTGYVRDQELLGELYCNCYAYIHGHQFGGTNPTLLQALATGSCILALDTPFTREVLDGDEHGIYFPKDVDSAAALISEIDADECTVKAKRQTARDRIAEAYTWDSVVDKYVRLFERMIAGTAR
jgi:glycosyltransferase involved in cell wall biosynthesis